jgi:hypothetical protein
MTDAHGAWGGGAASADRGLDAAARVIKTSGFLHFLQTKIDGDEFRGAFADMRVPRTSQPGSYPLVPDYVGFLGSAFAALDTAATRWPGAMQVDFTKSSASSE